MDPAAQRLIVGEQIEDGLVGAGDIGRVARQRRPTKRPFALAEQRADVGWHKAGVLEGALVASRQRHPAQIVAVVEHDRASVLQGHHRRDVLDHRGGCAAHILGRIGLAQCQRLGVLDSGGHIAAQGIVGAGLVGDHVGHNPAHHQLAEDLGGIAKQADRQRTAFAPRLIDQGHRLFERIDRHIEIAGLQAPLHTLRIDLDHQRHAIVHRHRQRLRPAHPAEARRQHEAPAQRAAKVLAGQLGQGLVGALQNPLGADIDPRAGGHLAVHRQAGVLKLAELLPGGPVGHQQRVGDQHAGRVGVSLLTAAGLPELIAQSPEEYIQIAATLAADPARLIQTHRDLRERMSRSPLVDGKGFSRRLGAALLALANHD